MEAHNLINNRGSIQDIKNSLKLGLPGRRDLLKALANEREYKNRDTVVKLLLESLKKHQTIKSKP